MDGLMGGFKEISEKWSGCFTDAALHWRELAEFEQAHP